MHKFFLFQIIFKSQKSFKELYCHLFVVCNVHISPSFDLTLDNKHALFIFLVSIDTNYNLFLTSRYSHKRRKVDAVNAFVSNEDFILLVWS